MMALSGSMAFAAPAPKVTVFNQGGYVADYQVSYTVNGKQKTTTVNALVVGKKTNDYAPCQQHWHYCDRTNENGFIWGTQQTDI